MIVRMFIVALSFCATFATGCAHYPGEPLRRSGDEIVVCGQFFHTGAPVRLWLDPPNYDAYRIEKRFSPAAASQPTTVPVGSDAVEKNQARYGSWRNHVPAPILAAAKTGGWEYEALRHHVDLFVLHYDVCGTSRQCFKVLHDLRGLSVHFMLDVDGTIYQTLDLKERAWHAGHASGNDRSVGVEIANIGAYGPHELKTLDEWYDHDANGWPFLTPPRWMAVTGVRTQDFVARPARKELIGGTINGRPLQQYDYTPQQYASLAKLTATLCTIFPRMKLEFPRDAAGGINPDVLTEDELAAFSGVLGHWHIKREKIDPGPALDWERLRRETHRQMR